MQCRICGDDNAQYYSSRRMALCPSCLSETPAKLSRSQFDLAYWGEGYEAIVPASTRREFYEDYLTSMFTLDQYIAETKVEAI